MTIRLDVGEGGGRDHPVQTRRNAAESHLQTLPDPAIWVWSDGSAEAGVNLGGGGAFVALPHGETREIRVAAGQVCSSTRAELFALRAALQAVVELEGDAAELPVNVCLDSQAALSMLDSGPAAHTAELGAAIWRLLLAISSHGQPVHLQWVPALWYRRQREGRRAGKGGVGSAPAGHPD